MSSASVKSFLIADLLVGKSSNYEEKHEHQPQVPYTALDRKNCETAINYDTKRKYGGESSGSGSSRSSTPDGKGGLGLTVVDARKDSTTTPSGSPASSSEDDKSYKSKSPIRDIRPLTSVKYEGGSMPGSYYPYSGFPMIYPVAPIPINAVAVTASSMTETESGSTKSYANVIPYNYEAFRQNRNLYGRHHASLNPMMLPSVSGIPHGGHLSQGMEYSMYHANFHGLYGMPIGNGVAGMHEKGSVAGERDNNYAMFHLGRPMYTVSCKRKGGQIRFTNGQTAQLEKAFGQQKYLNASDRKKLAHSLGLSDRQVKTWFQNRRAKLRKVKGGICSENGVTGAGQETKMQNLRFESRREVQKMTNMKDGSK